MDSQARAVWPLTPVSAARLLRLRICPLRPAARRTNFSNRRKSLIWRSSRKSRWM